MDRKSKKQPESDPEYLRLKNNHTWENGRRYHGYKSEFPFPDDYETKASSIWHHLTSGKPFALGRLLKDWDGFYVNVFKHLVPGGWVEIREHDLKFCPREGKEKETEGKWDATKQWSELMHEAAQKFGKRINMGVPTREWKDDPTTTKNGSKYHTHMIYHIEGYSLRLFTKTLGWSKEDTDDLLKRVLQELVQEDLQLYSLFYLVIGRKPTSAAR
ncbi:hypothetical protein BDW66DRAFT_158756 [Aspergillus desertorum]